MLEYTVNTTYSLPHRQHLLRNKYSLAKPFRRIGPKVRCIRARLFLATEHTANNEDSTLCKCCLGSKQLHSNPCHHI